MSIFLTAFGLLLTWLSYIFGTSVLVFVCGVVMLIFAEPITTLKNYYLNRSAKCKDRDKFDGRDGYGYQPKGDVMSKVTIDKKLFERIYDKLFFTDSEGEDLAIKLANHAANQPCQHETIKELDSSESELRKIQCFVERVQEFAKTCSGNEPSISELFRMIEEDYPSMKDRDINLEVLESELSIISERGIRVATELAHDENDMLVLYEGTATCCPDNNEFSFGAEFCEPWSDGAKHKFETDVSDLVSEESTNKRIDYIKKLRREKEAKAEAQRIARLKESEEKELELYEALKKKYEGN